MLALEGVEGRTDLPRQRGEDKRDSRQQQKQHVQGPCGQKELTHYEMYLERREGRHGAVGPCRSWGGV